MGKRYKIYDRLWFVCKFCKLAFVEKGDLKFHKRQAHCQQLKSRREEKRRLESGKNSKITKKEKELKFKGDDFTVNIPASGAFKRFCPEVLQESKSKSRQGLEPEKLKFIIPPTLVESTPSKGSVEMSSNLSSKPRKWKSYSQKPRLSPPETGSVSLPVPLSVSKSPRNGLELNRKNAPENGIGISIKFVSTSAENEQEKNITNGRARYFRKAHSSSLGFKREPVSETKSKPESKLRTESETKSKPESKLRAESETKSKSESKFKPESEAKSISESKFKPELETRSKSESKFKLESESKLKSKPESKLRPEWETKAKPVSETKSKPEPETESKPESKSKPEKELKADLSCDTSIERNVDPDVEELEEMKRKLEFFKALGMMPKSLYDAQRPGRYYIRKRNGIINYRDSKGAKELPQNQEQKPEPSLQKNSVQTSEERGKEFHYPKCRKCCLPFLTKLDLEDHEKTCQKYKCKKCDNYYSDIQSLTEHEWVNHESHESNKFEQVSSSINRRLRSSKAQVSDQIQFQIEAPVPVPVPVPAQIPGQILRKSPRKRGKIGLTESGSLLPLENVPRRNECSSVLRLNPPPVVSVPFPIPIPVPIPLPVPIPVPVPVPIPVPALIPELKSKVPEGPKPKSQNYRDRKDDQKDKEEEDDDDDDDETASLFCSLCHKAFTQPYQIKLHNFLKHSAHNKFKCHVCAKSFRSQDGLNYHVVWHKKEIRDSDIGSDSEGQGFVSLPTVSPRLGIGKRSRSESTYSSVPINY